MNERCSIEPYRKISIFVTMMSSDPGIICQRTEG